MRVFFQYPLRWGILMVGWNPFSEIFSTDIVLVSVYEICKMPRSTLLLNTVFQFVTDEINVLKFIIVLF